MQRSSRVFVPLFLSLFLLGVFPAYAQFTTGSALNLTVSPQNPRPYQTVTITPDSNQIDLNASVITVSVNGKVIEKGTGGQSVPVTVGGPGELTTISVSAATGGKTYTSQVSFRPADVALVVEPVSTTHPFYLGGALTAPQGIVHIVALPDLRTTPAARINPASLVYTWKLGDQVLTQQSGIGRSVLIANAPMRYRDAQVTVTVTNVDSTLVAQSSTVVSPVDPIVRMYRNDVLMGPDFDHALFGTYTMADTEESFRGVAYYFGALPALGWAVNGQPASTDKDVTVRSTGTGQGTASLSLTASNSDTYQTVTATLPVQFGAKKTNIFGF